MVNEDFSEYLKEYKRYLVVLGYSESVCKNYPLMVGRFLNEAQKADCKEIKNLNKTHVSSFKSVLDKTNRNKTYLNGYLSALRSFSSFLFLNYKMQLPVSHLYNYKSQTVTREILTQKEVFNLFEQSKGKNKYNLRNKALLCIYYGLGLRRTEGVNLRVQDIDFRSGYVFIQITKSNKQRIVPMSRMVQIYLLEYLKYGRPCFAKANYSRHLFLSKKGFPVDGQTLLDNLKEMLEESKIEKQHIGLHTLRHSIATHLMEKGLSFEYISHFLGHNTLKSTQIYTHVEQRTY